MALLCKEIEVDNIPASGRRGKGSARWQSVVLDFIASDAQAWEVTEPETKLANLRNGLDWAVRSLNRRRTVRVTQRSNRVFLIKT